MLVKLYYLQHIILLLLLLNSGCQNANMIFYFSRKTNSLVFADIHKWNSENLFAKVWVDEGNKTPD